MNVTMTPTAMKMMTTKMTLERTMTATTNAWGSMMRAAFAMGLVPSTIVDARASLRMRVIAKGPRMSIRMASATMSIRALVRMTATAMAFVTTWTTAMAHMTRAVCAMVQGPSTIAAAATFLKATATVRATSRTFTATARITRLTRMETASMTRCLSLA